MLGRELQVFPGDAIALPAIAALGRTSGVARGRSMISSYNDLVRFATSLCKDLQGQGDSQPPGGS